MNRVRALTITFWLLAAGLAFGSEVSVDPGDNGTDIVEDTTEDTDSRSSEVAVAVEQLVDPAPQEDELPAIPLAEAVTAAAGSPEPMLLLGTEVAPGTAQRLSWSATELFEGVPVSTPVLVVGDLNATPWSSGFRALERRGSLVDSLRGRGLQPSWPEGFGPLMIPIDHALHTTDLAVADRRTGPASGSAHRPLVVSAGRTG